MNYLFYGDFKKLIQSENLNQIVGNDLSLIKSIGDLGEEEVISYLSSKYDTSTEFKPILPYDSGKIYYAGDRVYLDAPVYNANQTYDLYYLTLYQGNVYICFVAITVPEAFNSSHWVFLGPQYQIFSAQLPYPSFDYYKPCYNPGDVVFYKNKVYTNVIGTYGIDYDTLIQQNTARSRDYYNIFPDEPNRGLDSWGAGVDYSIPAGTLYAGGGQYYAPSYSTVRQAQYTSLADNTVSISLPSLIGKPLIQIILEIKPLKTSEYNWNQQTGLLTLNAPGMMLGQTLFILYSNFNPTLLTTAYWIQQDNRSQQLLTICLDISLYHLHSRIAPRNIPDLRVKRYDDAISTLKKFLKGDTIPQIIKLQQPSQGRRIRYYSEQKQQNGY